MSFGDSSKENWTTQELVFLISSFIFLITIPIWAPMCAPSTPLELSDCQFKCEKVLKKQFIEVNERYPNNCHCGRSLNFYPIEIRHP